MSNEIQADLIGLQNALLNADNVEQFLHELAVLSTRTVTDGLSCGMTLRQRGRPAATAACTDPLASQADEVQYQTGDGPCLHAIRSGELVHIRDVAGHDRWPRFCRQAASLGIRSCLAVPLITAGEPIGALNLYARRPFAFEPAQIQRAEGFARHASGALSLALRIASCESLNDQLRSSIVSRAIIDQALGLPEHQRQAARSSRDHRHERERRATAVGILLRGGVTTRWTRGSAAGRPAMTRGCFPRCARWPS
jgi:GAF domain-containing protein